MTLTHPSTLDSFSYDAPSSEWMAGLTSSSPEERIEATRDVFMTACEAIAHTIIGEEQAVTLSMLALLSGQHALLLGPSGIAKTSLIETLAALFGVPSVYLAGASDTLASDWTGAEIPITDLAVRNLPIDERTLHFAGPIEGKNIVMADEFNRNSASAQSALLRAMQNGEVVTAAGRRIVLPQPFVVFAAMNPYDRGTQPLPEANADRFALGFFMGPELVTEKGEPALRQGLSRADLAALLSQSSFRQTTSRFPQTLHEDDQPIFQPNMLLALQRVISQDVALHPDLDGYLADLHQATMTHTLVARPLGYRGPLALRTLAQARAACAGRIEVTPDDIKALYPTVYRCRLNDPSYRKIDVVAQDVLETTPVPRSAARGFSQELHGRRAR